jgi:hypothetical protein
MSEGRRRRFPEGTVLKSVRVDRNLAEIFKDDFSGAVNRALGIMAGRHNVDKALEEHRELSMEIYFLQTKALEMEKRRDMLMAAIQAGQAAESKYIEARLRHLEQLQTGLKTNRSWYEARSDVLSECGWSSAEEAERWKADTLKTQRR